MKSVTTTGIIRGAALLSALSVGVSAMAQDSGAYRFDHLVRSPMVHYIERTAGMYVVTTVYACLEHDLQSDVCINYGAVNARHFDARVLREPDQVYEELQALAEPGFCDHSFIHLQEAANTPPRR